MQGKKQSQTENEMTVVMAQHPDVGSLAAENFWSSTGITLGKITSPQQKLTSKGGYVVTCDYCEESFVSFYNLRVHMCRKHGIGQQLSCGYCGARFRSKKTLDKHLESCKMRVGIVLP